MVMAASMNTSGLPRAISLPTTIAVAASRIAIKNSARNAAPDAAPKMTRPTATQNMPPFLPSSAPAGPMSRAPTCADHSRDGDYKPGSVRLYALRILLAKKIEGLRGRPKFRHDYEFSVTE